MLSRDEPFRLDYEKSKTRRRDDDDEPVGVLPIEHQSGRCGLVNDVNHCRLSKRRVASRHSQRLRKRTLHGSGPLLACVLKDDHDESAAWVCGLALLETLSLLEVQRCHTKRPQTCTKV